MLQTSTTTLTRSLPLGKLRIGEDQHERGCEPAICVMCGLRSITPLLCARPAGSMILRFRPAVDFVV